MSPFRKRHFAIRKRRVRDTVDCLVPGTTLRPRMPRRPIRITFRQPPRPRRLRMPRRPPIRITSRQTPMSRHPLIPSRSGHPLIGAGKSDPSSKVTSNIRTKLTEPRTSTSAVDSKRPCVDDVSHSESTIYCCARAPAATDKRPSTSSGGLPSCCHFRARANFLPPRPPQTEFGIFGWRGVLSQNLIFRITTYKDTTQMAI
jgi:hypothetical protein